MIFLNSYLLSPRAFALLYRYFPPSFRRISFRSHVSHRRYLSRSHHPHIRDFPLNLILIIFRFYFPLLFSFQFFFPGLFYRFIASRLRVFILRYHFFHFVFSRNFHCTFSSPSISSIHIATRASKWIYIPLRVIPTYDGLRS